MVVNDRHGNKRMSEDPRQQDPIYLTLDEIKIF
jgi:hypothetical protein